jgi:hypothetical protein
MCYRTAHVLHAEVMAAFKFVIPVYLVNAELLIISSLFQVIRLLSLGGPLVTGAPLLIALATVTVFRSCLEIAVRLTNLSVNFSCLPFSQRNVKEGLVSREERRFFKSCKSLSVRIGGTFTVTRETFPTVAQHILINYLVTLLISF